MELIANLIEEYQFDALFIVGGFEAFHAVSGAAPGRGSVSIALHPHSASLTEQPSPTTFPVLNTRWDQTLVSTSWSTTATRLSGPLPPHGAVSCY